VKQRGRKLAAVHDNERKSWGSGEILTVSWG